MIVRIRQENGGKLRLLVPHPKERRRRVKVVIGEWDSHLKKLAKKSDILVLAKRHELKSSERKGAFLIKGPGEYEVKGVFVRGVVDSGEEPIYVVRGEESRICYIHSFSKKELDARTLEDIGVTDILVFPIEAGELPSSKKVKSILSQIDPFMVVFSWKGGKKEKSKLEEWLKGLDVKDYEEEEEFIFNKSDFDKNKTQYFILSDGG